MKRRIAKAALGALLSSTAITAVQSAPRHRELEAPAKSASAASRSSMETASVAAPFQPVRYRQGTSVTAYVDNDPGRVATWLQAQLDDIPGKPDRFSTEAERNQYVVALGERARTIGQLAFVHHCPRSYDPDQSLYVFKPIVRSVQKTDVKAIDDQGLELGEVAAGVISEVTDSYLAQNGYGATFEVSRRSVVDLSIVFPRSISPRGGYHEYNRGSNMTSYEILVKMEPSEARRRDADLACLYVVSVLPPIMFGRSSREFPKRDTPLDLKMKTISVFGTLDMLLVMDRHTGQVFETLMRPGYEAAGQSAK